MNFGCEPCKQQRHDECVNRKADGTWQEPDSPTKGSNCDCQHRVRKS